MSDTSDARQPGSEIITFYSFKGGTGRTMALANVAWILAANGKRVLVADWDLESPGLHRFFQPFLDVNVSERQGIVDFIRDYEWKAVALAKARQDSKGREQALTELIDRLVKVERYAVPLKWEFPGNGRLDFMSAGMQNIDYQATLSALDWDTFYNHLQGGRFLDTLRDQMKSQYDYALIDSRTGLSDVAGICTLHMPDTVVDCFTLSTQGIEGAADIAKMIKAGNKRDIRILPVPMRIDPAEKDRADDSLMFASRKFEGLPAGLDDSARRDYWASVRVPYQAFYSYEETLAVFGDMPGSPDSLLSSFERLTAQVTGATVAKLPPMSDTLRLRTKARFARRLLAASEIIALDFTPEDQLWAEWVEAVLTAGGVPVQRTDEPGPPDPGGSARVLALVTPAYARRMADEASPALPDQAICLTDVRLPHQLNDLPVLFLAGLDEELATSRLLDRLGGSRRPGQAPVPVRYPGMAQPRVVNLPARNANFTGREPSLRTLRAQLRERGTAVVLPALSESATPVAVTIQGLGGVGKTQVALEYAHRFRADYDVIWWMNCGQAQYIDSALIDLGKRMRDAFGVSLPEENVAEAAAQVLEFLSTDRAGYRWLLIYDNADDIAEVERLLPAGGGHTLITSRNRGWNDVGTSVQFDVDVFTRDESLSHLRQRVPAITAQEAGEVAQAVGDLPLAIATAGAWLADTKVPVRDYLERLQQQAPQALSLAQFREYHAPGDATARPRSGRGQAGEEQTEPIWGPWSVSLDRLQETSRAAARLLELCAVTAPDISLDHIIYSKTMADVLRRTDSSITEPLLIGRLIQRIDRLALIKLDDRARQVQVHRLVQAVVRERLGAERIEQTQHDVHRLLVAARPEGEVDNPETWPRYRAIWLHLTPSRAMWSHEEDVRQLLIERVRYLRQRSDLERGRRRAREIESAWKEMLAGPLPEPVRQALQVQLLRLRFQLANIVRDLAEFETARDIDEAVLTEQRKLLGDEHPHSLMTRGSLAADLRALGEYDQALTETQATYNTWAREFGESHRGTLNAAHNLAVSLRLTGRFEEALDCDIVNHNRLRNTWGENDPRTVDSSLAIARDLLETGQYADAVSRLETVVVQRREGLGDDDRATLIAQAVLGSATRCNGDAVRAEELIETALGKLTSGWGSESTDALACRLSQANNLVALHRYDEARAAAEWILEVYQSRLGATHPQTLICWVSIAIALCRQDEPRLALEAATNAADGLAGRLGQEHPYALVAQLVRASALADQDRMEEAIQLEELAADGLTSALGRAHPDTLRCHANLLLSRQRQGNTAAADRRELVIQQLGEQIGEQHPDIKLAAGGGRLLRAIDPQPF